MNSVAWAYLPYFAFLGLVIAGLHYRNMWAIAFGILALYFYDPKPKLKIICKQHVYYKCICEKEQGK